MSRVSILETLAAAAILAVFTAMACGEASHQSATVDEFHLVPQAIALRQSGDLEVGYKTPPLLKRWISLAISPSEVSLPDTTVDGRPASGGWDPWIFGTRFMVANGPSYDRLFFRARLMMLPLAWALGIAIFLWARVVGGRVTGLVALLLFAFAPEMIAAASIVSLDLAVTLLVVGCLALLRLHRATGGVGALVASFALFGLGLSVKLSVLLIAPVYLLLCVPSDRLRRGWGYASRVALAAAAGLLALHASYGFDRPIPRWEDLTPKSRGFRALDRVMPASLPIPLPFMWLRALDAQAHDVEKTDVLSYLDGTWSRRGWRRYYLMAWLYKTPLPTLGLVAVVCVSFLRRFRKNPLPAGAIPGWTDALLIGAPILLWGGAFSLAGGLQIGVRYVLPCYALGMVGLGVLIGRLPLRGVLGALAAALLAAVVVASVTAFPHHLSYFNAIGGGERHAYLHLSDSNLDWGQELKHLAAYLRERGIERVGLGYFGHVAPELYGIDYFVPEGPPAPGWYAISANFLAGYSYLVYDHGRLRMLPGDQFAGFRGLEPSDTLGGAMMIYRVP